MNEVRSLLIQSAYFFHREKKVIENIEKNIDLMNPVNVLKRGYSITMANGKVLQKVEGIKEGDMLETVLNDGTIASTVTSFKKMKIE